MSTTAEGTSLVWLQDEEGTLRVVTFDPRWQRLLPNARVIRRN